MCYVCFGRVCSEQACCVSFIRVLQLLSTSLKQTPTTTLALSFLSSVRLGNTHHTLIPTCLWEFFFFLTIQWSLVSDASCGGPLPGYVAVVPFIGWIPDTKITYHLPLEIVSEYDQEIPQSQTEDSPVALRGRAAQPSRDTRKTN